MASLYSQQVKIVAAGNTSGKIRFIFCGSMSAPVEFSVGKLRFELSEAFCSLPDRCSCGSCLCNHPRCKNRNRAFLFQALPWEWGFHRLSVF